MISKKIIITTIVFFSVIRVYAQSEKIDFIYEMVWKEDSLKPERTKREDMILQIKGAESCFQSMINHNYENYIVEVEKNMKSRGILHGGEVKKNIPVFKYRIFKAQSTLKVEEQIMRKPYAYEMDFDPDQWQIQAEQDSIAGFWSQKAMIDHNGRSYIAWFTTEIPVSDGPYIFHGLPGLIVKLYDTQDHYTFTLKEVSKAGSIWPPMAKNAISSTFKEVSELKRNLRQDPLTDPLVSGFFSDPEAIENLRKRARANNNPLERNQ